MGLRDIVPVQQQVKVGDQSFGVSGLSVEHLSILLGTNKTELSQLMNSGLDLKTTVLQYPDFVATIITMASGDADAKEQAKALPLGVQIEALTKIWEQTIPDPAVMGKMLGLIGTLLQKLVESPEFESMKSMAEAGMKTLGNSGSES